MENEKLLAKNLFDYSRTIAKPLLETVDYPWEALPKISEFIIELGKTLDPEIYEQRGENVWIAKSAKVFDSAYLGGLLSLSAKMPKSDSVLLSEAMQLSAGVQL